jgi:F0F1-type ATP synthase gamma subunit
MKSIKRIKIEISMSGDVRGMVQVYEEISAQKMKEIRDGILSSRQFLERLSVLSSDIGADLASVTARIPKKATVYLSSSSGLFGDLPEKVFSMFLENIKSVKGDIFIVGKQGEIYMKTFAPSVTYKMYDMPDDKMPEESLSQISNLLAEYSEIAVFYGRFKNLVIQDAVSGKISGESITKISNKNEEEMLKKQARYIYEPTINAVSEKFRTEILAVLIEGMARENQLAKYGSRLMHLDTAYEKIEEDLVKLNFDLRREVKKREDKKQIERVSRLIN